jgi:hypothetical protein
MNQWNEEQFDRVARWLDGEQTQLTDSERELGDEFLADEKDLGDSVQVTLPLRAARRANRRVLIAVRGMRIRRRVTKAFLSGVSAAAMIVISLGLINLMATGSLIPDYDPLAWLFNDGQQNQEVWSMPDQDPQLALLSGDLDEIELAMFTPQPVPVPIETPRIEEPDHEIDEDCMIWPEDSMDDSEILNNVNQGSCREV